VDIEEFVWLIVGSAIDEFDDKEEEGRGRKVDESMLLELATGDNVGVGRKELTLRDSVWLEESVWLMKGSMTEELGEAEDEGRGRKMDEAASV
jgi:hypothetical protein